MKRYIFPLFLCTIIGSLMGFFIIKQYNNPTKIIPTFNEQEKLYFLNQGIYESKEIMEKNTNDFSYYVYQEKDNKFYVYVGITKEKDNLDKLTGYFKNKGYIINVEEYEITNESFLTILSQYDELLKNTTDEKTIKAICSQVLSKYEELISSENNQTNAKEQSA